MKPIKYIGVLAILVVSLLIPGYGQAQENKKFYANADWQFNIPLDNSFTKAGSGWGMNFEGGYFVTPKIGLGLFLAYSTNHKYIDTQTLNIGTTGTLTTNQQRSMFQMPFGATIRYTMNRESWMSPYVALKLGTEYCQLSSYISTYQLYERNWGFYMSPEVGSTFWVTPAKNFGIHLALYYSFSTNKGSVLDGNIDKLNNIGFRLGLGF